MWVAWLAVSLVYQQHYTHIKGVSLHRAQIIIVIVRKPCTLKHVSAICNLCQLQLMTDKIFFRPGYGGDRVGAIHSILAAQVKTIDTDWENLRASPGGPWLV